MLVGAEPNVYSTFTSPKISYNYQFKNTYTRQINAEQKCKVVRLSYRKRHVNDTKTASYRTKIPSFHHVQLSIIVAKTLLLVTKLRFFEERKQAVRIIKRGLTLTTTRQKLRKIPFFQPIKVRHTLPASHRKKRNYNKQHSWRQNVSTQLYSDAQISFPTAQILLQLDAVSKGLLSSTLRNETL